MNIKLSLLTSCVALSLCFCAPENSKKLVVSNTTSNDRSELVSIAKADVDTFFSNNKQLVITDASGKQVPYQITHDEMVIFPVCTKANSSSTYKLTSGKCEEFAPQVFGKHYPERVDDIAWENNRVAFRTYGPQLQQKNERAFGYDIWNKRTEELVVDARYNGELNPSVKAKCDSLRAAGLNDEADDLYNSVSYHVDHGNGMDCYKVGPTLGGGTAALLDANDQIVYPYCWAEYKILDNGPLRFTVELTYNPTYIDGDSVVETRLISLDAGSQLNKTTVTYANLSTPHKVAAGIVVHPENPDAYILSNENKYMAYEDLGDPNQYKEKYREAQNKDFGKIYVGAVFTGDIDTEYRAFSEEEKPLHGNGSALGHILGKAQYDKQFSYYWGAGWSRNEQTNIHSLEDWTNYLKEFSDNLNNPLQVTIE